MKCAQCPLSLVCWAGALETTDGSRTFLCPYCGNFAVSSFPENKDSDAYRAGMRGFQCEKRRLDDVLRERWRIRRGHEVKVSDPASLQAYIILRPCPFCRSSEWDNVDGRTGEGY